MRNGGSMEWKNNLFVQANAGKIERQLRKLSNCNNEIRELKEE